jgi:hypothetical protein
VAVSLTMTALRSAALGNQQFLTNGSAVCVLLIDLAKRRLAPYTLLNWNLTLFL